MFQRRYSSNAIDLIGSYPMKPSTQGWSRTNDVRFRKPALYPLSYKGVCRLVAGTSQLVFRLDGIHIIFSLVVMGCDFHGFRY